MAVLIAALVTLLAGCGAQPATGPGLSQEEVCERFVAMLGQAGGMTHSEDSAGGVTSPPQAVQHRAQATAALTFAQEARPVADPDLAVQVAAVEAGAQRVLDELSADAGDAAAETVTESLYRATTELYAVCVADAYRAVLEGEVELTGACAEPGAPSLEGPASWSTGSVATTSSRAARRVRRTSTGLSSSRWRSPTTRTPAGRCSSRARCTRRGSAE